MDVSNGETRNAHGESLVINASEPGFRVGQNGSLPTFATQTQLGNGSAQMQSEPALEQEQRQEAPKGQVAGNQNVDLSVTGSLRQETSGAAVVDDARSQVAVETSADGVSGAVVIPQEYLSVAGAAQGYISTEAQNGR